MADFMDFNAWRDLAAESEQEVMQRQLADVESKTQAANSALSRAQQEAQLKRLEESKGAGVASSTLTSVGSYSDYLKAKQAQANAQALLASRQGGELGDVRFATGSSIRNQGAAMGAALQGREAAVGQQDASGLVGANRLAEERRAREAAAAAAAAEREKATGEARGSYLASLVGGAKGRGGAGGTQLDFVGSYNPYASSEWARQQGGQEAAAAKAAGASDEQIQTIWGAYTRKGEWGQGPRNPINRQAAMNPWLPK